MTTLILDLGPGVLKSSNSSPFEISVNEWKNIRDYVVRISNTSEETTTQIITHIPAFGDLKRAAIKWQHLTFPKLIQLSDSIYQYGTTTVKSNYTELLKILQSLETGKPSKSVRDTFNRIIQNCSEDAENNLRASWVVVGEVIEFINAMQAAYDQSQNFMNKDSTRMTQSIQSESPEKIYRIFSIMFQAMQPILQLQSIVSVLQTPPLADVQRIRGAWEAIKSDLAYLQNSVNSQIAIEEPFLSELNIQLAISSWDKLGMEAYDFARNAEILG